MSALSRAVARCVPVLAVAAAACGSDSTGPVVSSVTVTATTQTVVVGQSLQLTATARDGSGTIISGQQTTWSSGTEAVATVSTTGLVTGVTPGTTLITASIRGHSGSLTVTVTLPPVASIVIAPTDPAVEVNGTVQLTATTLDAGGTELTGRTVTWSSASDAIATVGTSGLATGVSPGTVNITATSEGITASVPLTVTGPAGSLAITSIAPSPLVEGASATVIGDGFSATAAGNTVTIDGVPATVTAASATSLTITVPSAGCMPARGNAVVSVTVSGQTAQLAHSVRPAAFMDIPVGQLTLLSDPNTFCLQFDAAATSSAYVIGVQSVSETPGSRTPVRVRSQAAGGGGAIAAAPLRSEATGGSVEPARPATRQARHRDAERDLRMQDHALASELFAAARRAGGAGAGALRMANAMVPATVNVGDTVSVRVPSADDLCSGFATIDAVVRHRGTRSIWIEDVDNPADGYSAAQYQDLGDMMDDRIWPSNTTYLGEPTDVDSNGRVVIVVTKEVNARENLLGFVSAADFYPTECPAANGGEYYYGRAPDPTGTAGAAYPTADAFVDAPSLIAHEFAHVIQVGRRIYTPGATSLASIWELEGQATFAEEVAGHVFAGNSIGQNYGFATAWNEAGTPPIPWYRDSFVDLALYYGFESPESRITGAPEQCGWLGRPSDTDALGPCLGGRSVYGVSWSFLRWLSDQYGPAYPGGEAALHRALVVHTSSGFATISGVVGAPIDELLAGWAASLYVDDRFTGMNPRLRFTSWNLSAISNGLVATAHLTPRARSFSTFTDHVTVIAGSTAYFDVSGATRPAAALSVRTAAGDPLPANMRVWIVRTQ